MNRTQSSTVAEPVTEEVDDHETARVAETQNRNDQRVAILSSITTSPVIGSGMMAFLPRDMMQAIEFSKMMAAGNFVPPHLRGNAGDCLAVVLQSIRWRADPFAVAGKTYFINDRIAFEAQLVNAVLNTSTVLDGRLQITWQGKVQTSGFQCTVRGRIKGDEEVHELIQESDTITKKNSPLWKMSERIQIGYYTTRGWGRLYTPEVMLGIYTPDEIEDGMGDDAHVIGQQIIEPKTYSIPPRPTRESVKAEKEAIDRQQREAEDREAHVRTTAREETPHDSETGEVTDAETQPSGQAESEQAAAETAPSQTYQALYDELLAKVKQTGNPKSLNALLSKDETAADLDLLRTEAPELSAAIVKDIAGRRAWFAR